MRHLLLGLAVLLATASTASAAQLDDAAAALRSSPVYVAPGAKPGLSAAEQQRLRGAIANADTPVFVAVVPASALDETGGDADLFVRRLYDAEGQPGTYAVVAGNRFRAGSSTLKSGQAGELATKAIDAHRSDGVGATLVDFVDRVGAAERGGSSGGGGSGSG